MPESTRLPARIGSRAVIRTPIRTFRGFRPTVRRLGIMKRGAIVIRTPRKGHERQRHVHTFLSSP